jgi:hypothetical protein
MNEELQKWKKLCQRAFAMSPKELVERMRQQMRARADLLRYRAGFPFNPSFIQQTDVRREPNFFFSSADVPRLCSRLRELFPQTANEILERANRICEHRFDLLGYKDLDYEPEID